MQNRFWMLAVVAAAFLLFPFGTGWADADVGQDPPSFVAKTREGKTFDLSALKGKVVVVNFWATWSLPCREELPALEAIWRRFRGQGVEVLAVNADGARTRKDVTEVLKYFSFPVARLADVSKNELVDLKTVPVTYIIGKDGKVADILAPPLKPLTEEGVAAQVTALLKVKPEAKPEESKPEAAKVGEKPEEKK